MASSYVYVKTRNQAQGPTRTNSQARQAHIASEKPISKLVGWLTAVNSPSELSKSGSRPTSKFEPKDGMDVGSSWDEAVPHLVQLEQSLSWRTNEATRITAPL